MRPTILLEGPKLTVQRQAQKRSQNGAFPELSSIWKPLSEPGSEFDKKKSQSNYTCCVAARHSELDISSSFISFDCMSSTHDHSSRSPVHFVCRTTGVGLSSINTHCTLLVTHLHHRLRIVHAISAKVACNVECAQV